MWKKCLKVSLLVLGVGAAITAIGVYSWAKKSDIVSCYFEGQLGNNLFQVATAYAIAQDHNARPVFPKKKILNNTNGALNLEHVFHRVDTGYVKKKWSVFREKSPYDYEPIPYEKNLKLRGYFQSEKYFAHRKKEIQELFAPKEELVASIYAAYGNLLAQKETVAVHVRTFIPEQRDPNKGVDWNYYKEAMAHFSPDATFLVFSDSPEWIKEHFFMKGDNIVFVENPHYFDFYMMSLCKHQIVSPNSTFSWWAAYLNTNPEKKVIAPKLWSSDHENDVVPKDWITI